MLKVKPERREKLSEIFRNHHITNLEGIVMEILEICLSVLPSCSSHLFYTILVI